MRAQQYNELLRLAHTTEGLRGPIFKDDFCRDLDDNDLLVDVDERLTIAGDDPFSDFDCLDLAVTTLDDVFATNESVLDSMYYSIEDEDVEYETLLEAEPNEYRELSFD